MVEEEGEDAAQGRSRVAGCQRMADPLFFLGPRKHVELALRHDQIVDLFSDVWRCKDGP